MFRAGVFGRQRAQAGARLGGGDGFFADQLGDAEIEQFGSTCTIDEHIVRLDVAMHDQLAVRGLHGIDYRQQQFDASAQVEAVLACVARDRDAGYVLHHQVGRAVGVIADVEQGRDMRMTEIAEDALLLFETRAQVAGVESEQFDRDRFVEGAVGADCAVDAAHAAEADQCLEPVAAETFAAAVAAARGGEHVVETDVGRFVRGEQLVGQGTQSGIVAADRIQICVAPHRLELHRRAENFQGAPLEAHAGEVSSIAMRRNASAAR